MKHQSSSSPRKRPCPKCSGRGSFVQATWVPGTNVIRLDPDKPPVRCDRCNGKGELPRDRTSL